MEPDCGSTRGVAHFGKPQRFPDTANSRLTVGRDSSFGPGLLDITKHSSHLSTLRLLPIPALYGRSFHCIDQLKRCMSEFVNLCVTSAPLRQSDEFRSTQALHDVPVQCLRSWVAHLVCLLAVRQYCKTGIRMKYQDHSIPVRSLSKQ